jgi:hypothetical protein
MILLCTLSTSNYPLYRPAPLIATIHRSEKVIYSLVSVLFDKVNHTLCMSASLYIWGSTPGKTYSRHNGLTIVSFHITEGHFGPLMFVDNDLGIIDIFDLLQWH